MRSGDQKGMRNEIKNAPERRKEALLVPLTNILLQTVFSIVNLEQQFNSFSTNAPLLYPLRTSEKLRVFMFSEGIEVKHWLKMG